MSARTRRGKERLRTFIRGLLLPMVLWTAAAPAAFAQTRPSRSKEAKAHFARAVVLYGEADYAGAAVEFKKAYDIQPAWQVLFNLGQSYFQLRDYAHALVTLRRFAADGGERISKDDRATLDSELPDLENRVGYVRVDSSAQGAAVLVDDEVLGSIPLAEPLMVSIGMRKITVLPDGGAPIERIVAVGGGETVTVRLEVPEPAAPPPAVPSAPEPPRLPSAPSRLPAYVTFGAAAVGLAGGTVFGVFALGDKSRLNQACNASRACPGSSQPDIDALGRDGALSTVGFAVGAGLLALGTTLWILEQPGTAPVDRVGSSGASSGVSVHAIPGGVAGSF